MRYSDFHTHTIYSDGKNTPREMIEKAVALGMEAIGISDHSYTDHDLGYCMQKENEAAYIAELRALKEEYKDKIAVSIGLELDGSFEADRSSYDYMLGDCHNVKTPGGYFSVDHALDGHKSLCEDWFGGDYTAFARAYYEGYVAATQKMRPDILGHFDLVCKFCLVNESDPRYLSYAREALEASLAVTPYIELNTGAIARGYRHIPYPAPYLLEIVKEKGGVLLLGSDSHKTETLGFGFESAVEYLKENGIFSIAVLKNGKFEERGI